MIRKYAEIFCWKNVSAKATHIFSAKNTRILYTLQRHYNAVIGSHEHWPRYTWSALDWTWQPHPLAPLQFPPVIMRYYTLHVCYIVCFFFIYLFLFFFIVETLCMYLAWFPFHSFNPVNNKFLSLNCFVFFYDHSRELTATVLHLG